MKKELLKLTKQKLLFTFIAFAISLSVKAETYTLQDSDVYVTDGIITGCTYDFSIKDIIIPETLHEQTVTGIRDGSSSLDGVFSNKGITSVVLPSTLTNIGNKAFYKNDIDTIDLSNCSNLERIGHRAFKSNAIDTLILSTGTSLICIGGEAFYDNNIDTVSLTNFSALITIGENAFSENNITSFTLPANTNSDFNYWIDANDNHLSGGTIVTDLTTYYYTNMYYTLTDDDVVVTDGIITACSYDFRCTNIIIPTELDGQVIIGIADGITSSGVFASKGITSVKLPSTIQNIGNSAFYKNLKLDSLDLSNCSALSTIENNAFYQCSIINLDLSNCSSLTTLENYAFYGSSITSLDLSMCPILTTIGSYAFYNSNINTLNLSNNSLLTIIGSKAFQQNSIESIDLANCTALKSIGEYAFLDNNLDSITLPAVIEDGNKLDYWIDGSDNIYTSNEEVSNFYTGYDIIVPYVLTGDSSTIVNNELISFNSEVTTNIFIPDTLMDQQVDSIGRYAFYSDTIITVRFPDSVKTIGIGAFKDNYIRAIYFNNCPSLSTIADSAFYNDSLTHIDLSTCTSLTYIGTEAFDCAKLDSFVLPEPSINGYTFNYWEDGNSNQFNAGDTVSDLTTSYTAILSKIITSDDSINDDSTSEIATLSKANLKIYPNPANDYIYFGNAEGLNSVTIYNVTGQSVYNYSNSGVSSNELSINVSDFKKGIYILKTTVNGENYTNRLMIK